MNKKIILQLMALFAGITTIVYSSAVQAPTTRVYAAVSDWQKGLTIIPDNSPDDYKSDNFKQSLQNLRATGANFVALVVPFYQSNLYSTDVSRGWNTPSDEALSYAIDYAHSLGLKVLLKIHVDSYGGEWRAYINPWSRDQWFNNYGTMVLNTASIGQAHGAEMISIGTELATLTSRYTNSTNTAHWQDLIKKIRGIYSGKLTYGANSTSNDYGQFTDEKENLDFWQSLDYVGLSVYYNLNSDSSVSGMKKAWDFWNQNDLKAFFQRINKPILFAEIGYRSVDGAHYQPWNWGMGGGANQQEQANAYQALLSYWNDYPYVQGVYFWDWRVNPNAGGSGDTDYTPQNKMAIDVLKQWFGSPQAPAPASNAPFVAFSESTKISGTAYGNVNTPITVTITNKGADVSNGRLVDVEVYSSNGTRLLQQYFNNESFAQNQSKDYVINWTPTTLDTYTVKVGIFTTDWTSVILWDNNALTIPVTSWQTTTITTPPAQNTATSTGTTATTTSSTTTSTTTTATSTSTMAADINIWWPTDGVTVGGVQPFKAMVPGNDVTNYSMSWQVDGDKLNNMYNSWTDYQHKEAMVDLGSWNWKGAGPYTLNFVAKDLSGTPLTSKSININVAH